MTPVNGELRLTQEQEKLLQWIGKRWEELRDRPRNFIAAVNPASGDFIEMGGERRSIHYSDLEELGEKRLVRYTERPQMGAGTRPFAERGAITADGLEYLAMASGTRRKQEPSILLTDEQKDTLVLLVEQTRRVSGGQRCEFIAYRALDADMLMVGSERYPTFFPDLQELDKKNLIRLTERENSASLVVSPEGFSFYEEIKRAEGEPIERVEAEVRHMLSRDVMGAYPEAAERWREAEDLLWKSDAEQQLTAIGHKCREALQSFAQSLYEQHCPDSEALPREKTLNKICAVLERHKASLGKTTVRFLNVYWEAVNAYWEAVNDLAERAEHGSQQEDRPLLWEDGRRLVFQTLLVMVELAAALRS
jgi:hypothetical protein